MATTTEPTFALTEEERRELLRVLEGCLVETRIEKRRTDTPAYHDEVAHEEKLLRGLLEKVRHVS